MPRERCSALWSRRAEASIKSSSGDKRFGDLLFQLVANEAEECELIFARTVERGGIGKIPVQGFCRRKRRAKLPCMIADGDDAADFLTGEFSDVFRALTRDVDADFFHDFNSQRIQAGGRDTCADDIVLIARQVPEQRLRHLAAGGVAGTKKKNARFHNRDLTPTM